MKEKKPISLMILIFIIALFINYHIYYYFENKVNNKKVDNYLIDIKDLDSYPQKIVNKNEEAYLGILEISKINLKQGFYSVNSVNNDVNKNIMLLKGSEMPNKKGTYLALASHSGASYLGYFSELDKLSINDEISIYYNNVVYHYVITDIYEEEKDGLITINRNIHENYLILTTCSKNKDMQLVIKAKLLNTKSS